MKDPQELRADNYVKNLLREDHPGKNEAEIEQIFQELVVTPRERAIAAKSQAVSR